MDNKKHSSHHIVPLSAYYKVWAALVVFTVITVATSYIDFGGHWNIIIAMLIASAKAMMVILIFMGLKYDGKENNVTFFSAFLFLAIFVSLTSTDLFYRRDDLPVRVDASEMAGAGTDAAELKKWIKPSPEALTKGKDIFAQQCMTCHGAGGHGDGPAAAALNPKPRNFTAGDGWKNGRKVTEIFGTLTKGLNAMPAFTVLKAEEKLALAHFVRSLGPTAPENTDAELNAMVAQAGGNAKPKLPIWFAIERMATE